MDDTNADNTGHGAATVALLAQPTYAQAADDIVRTRALSDGALRHHAERARAPSLRLDRGSTVAVKDLRPGLDGFDVEVMVLRALAVVKVNGSVSSSVWLCGQGEQRVEVQFLPPFAEPPSQATLLLLHCRAVLEAHRLVVKVAQFKLLETGAVTIHGKHVYNVSDVNVWRYPSAQV
jgi:hypothetical protein